MLRASTRDVFINCPFDSQYKKIFKALIFVIYACGFRPRSAQEIDDGGQARIEKLFAIIGDCRFGIHDISRTQLDANKLPRFNMPLELGIFLGAKRYGPGAPERKRILIFDTQKYRHNKFMSDLAGMDVHAHANDPNRAIVETRDWLANVSRRNMPSARQIVRLYKKFSGELPTLAKALNAHPNDMPYVDFERAVVGWLVDERG